MKKISDKSTELATKPYKSSIAIIVAMAMIILFEPINCLGQSDRYWSGNSPISDYIDQGTNWYGGTNPSSGDNLYFNNTGTRHWAYSNYGAGSFFANIITYNGAGGIKLYGDNTYAFKFENYNDGSLLELSPSSATSGNREIGNRIDHDLEINPVGSGGILVSCDKISLDNLNGVRTLKVYGNNTLTINGNIYDKNGFGGKLQILNSATIELKGNSTFTGATTINGGILKLNALGGALNSGNAVIISGGTLRVMQSQTIGDLTMSSGTLQVDEGAVLTITGAYNVSGGTVTNQGTIILASVSTAPQTKCIGDAFTPLSVNASGTGLTFQWYSNTTQSNSDGTILGSDNGATTATYTPQSGSAGSLYYYCVVSNLAISNVSGLFTVNPTSVGGTISGETTVCSGTNSTVLTLSGNVGNVVKWQYSIDGGTNWVDIVNTGTTYTATDLTVTTQYQAIVKSGECTSATSSVATLTVNPLPAAVTVEGAGTFCSIATITASNGGDGIIYFQGTTSGGTSTEFPSTSEDIIESGTYYFRAQSAQGCWGTEGSAVVVINIPTVTIVASANPIVFGASVTFTATPTNGGSAVYAWYINDILQPLFTGSTMSATPTDGANVYVIMTSNLCSSPVTATSNTITMIVNPAPATTIWTGGDDNNWYNPLNWSDGVPGSTSDVTILSGITYYPTLSSPAICKNLIMESGASILGNNYLFFSSGGSATVKRTISEGVWHFVSSPVIEATAGIFLHDYLQSWSETTKTWTDIIDPGTELFAGQGYGLYGMPGKSPTANHTYEFTGPLHLGNVERSISYTAGSTGYDGANLLGNPYPSAIDWGQVSGYGAVYYWNGSAYVAYPAGTNGYGTGSQYIPPMQGFFIVVPDNNPNTFTFTNAMRTHNGASNYYKSTKTLTDGLMLFATNGEYKDKLLIRQNEEANKGFDFELDAWKLPSNTLGISQLWSVSEDGNLSIDVHPATEVIQLGFANDQAGAYSIALDEMAGIGNAILEDTRENTFTDLGKGAYSFNWQPADNELRFRLHTGALAVAEKETTHTDIYSYQQTVYVNFNENINGDIYIYNLAGQLITAKESASGSVRIGLTSTGVYMIKVVTEKETLTQKVVIR